MPKGYLTFSIAVLVLLGHLGVLGYIFFSENRLLMPEKIDVALTVAPLTATYFTTITMFVIANQRNIIVVKEDKANLLYFIFSLAIVGAFLFAIFWALRSYMNYGITDISILKRTLGVIETFLGAAFALIMDSLFGSVERK